MDPELIEYLLSKGFVIVDEWNDGKILYKDTQTSHTEIQITVDAEEIPSIQVEAPTAAQDSSTEIKV